MIEFLGLLFSYLIKGCYLLTKDYGWAIVIFTIAAKVIQLPISVLVQKNSIKMVKMYPDMNRIKTRFYGSNDLISEENYKLYKQYDYHPIYDLIPIAIQLVLLMGVVAGLRKFTVDNTYFGGLDLSAIPVEKGGNTIWIPIIAAISSWLMCFTQNLSNVLQSEQSKANKYITMVISVGLSLYLGFFVEGGVGLYWITGNILAIIQLYILNFYIDPKKSIDYGALKESIAELEKVKQTVSVEKRSLTKEEKRKEKHDYKEFIQYGSKQLVFYSEHNGFYKYYKDVIEYILRKTNIKIHYVTNDINDSIFELTSDKFKTYYVSENKLIMLMMRMDADMVVMTSPDLQKYHIKRSMVRTDTEYVYMDHGIGSNNLMLRKHALDYFDTVFASNDIYYNELRAQEKTYNLKKKNIVKYGFCLIDNMIESYNNCDDKRYEKNILIAPSWQPDNILDVCIDELLDTLLKTDYKIIVRPHPQYVRHCKDRLNDLILNYSYTDQIIWQTDFSSNSTVFDASILLTDWSGIAYEYSLTTLKPSLFINTPMKIMNPDYEEIDVVPFDIEVRDMMGISIDLDNISGIIDAIDKLTLDAAYNKETMLMLRNKYLYNVGTSAKVGAKYIINRLVEMSKQ